MSSSEKKNHVAKAGKRKERAVKFESATFVRWWAEGGGSTAADVDGGCFIRTGGVGDGEEAATGAMKADRGGAATAADADGGGDDDAGPVKYFQFQFEPGHIEKGKRGQKVFVCDICHGIFKRSFSLKRHYLRFHINFALVSPRDLNNCAIVASNHRSIVPPSAGPVKKASLLYRCHQCGYLMASKADLLLPLQTHPPAPTETSPAPRAASASAGQGIASLKISESIRRYHFIETC